MWCARTADTTGAIAIQSFIQSPTTPDVSTQRTNAGLRAISSARLSAMARDCSLRIGPQCSSRMLQASAAILEYASSSSVTRRFTAGDVGELARAPPRGLALPGVGSGTISSANSAGKSSAYSTGVASSLSPFFRRSRSDGMAPPGVFIVSRVNARRAHWKAPGKGANRLPQWCPIGHPLRRVNGRPMCAVGPNHRGGTTMGKRDEIRRQIEALQREHDEAPDDDDDDLEIGVEKDGHKVTVKGRHARKVMRRLGLDDDDDQGAAGGEGEAGEGEAGEGEAGEGEAKGKPSKDKAPPSGHRYFR